MFQPNCNLVVFDTRQSSHFAREMCAFLTAQTGDPFVGEETALAARDSLRYLDWYEENVIRQEDDEGVDHIVLRWPTPGRVNYKGHQDFNDKTKANLPAFVSLESHPAYESVAIIVDELPPPAVLDELVERAKLFCLQRNLTFIGHRLLSPHYVERVVQAVTGYDEVL